MKTTVVNPAFQFRAFTELQHEAREAIRTGDLETARLALAEIEAHWMHTDWPRLREACSAFLCQHAEHADFAEFVA